MNLSPNDLATAERFLFSLATISEKVSREDVRIQVHRAPRRITIAIGCEAEGSRAETRWLVGGGETLTGAIQALLESAKSTA
jgi:hypothetical protein